MRFYRLVWLQAVFGPSPTRLRLPLLYFVYTDFYFSVVPSLRAKLWNALIASWPRGIKDQIALRLVGCREDEVSGGEVGGLQKYWRNNCC